MHFLASSLTTYARDTIESTEITANNFPVAQEVLCKKRFENKRRLIEVNVSTLYHLPSVSRKSAVDLHVLRDKAEKAIASLRRLNRSSDDILNDILVYFVSQKLDPVTKKAWKLKLGEQTATPSYDDLSHFISLRAIALNEFMSLSSLKSSRPQKVTSATATPAVNVCSLCNEPHFINKCPKFIRKNPSQHREDIKESKHCFNCLSAKHTVQTCTSKHTCRMCQQKYHIMLHLDSNPSSNTNNVTETANTSSHLANSPSVNALCSSFESRLSPVLLATARVIARSPTGRSILVPLLDQESEAIFVSERLAQTLRLKRLKTSVSVTAIECAEAGTCR